MSLEGEGPSLRELLEREHDCCARLAPILEAGRAAAAAIGNQARDADARATIEENVAVALAAQRDAQETVSSQEKLRAPSHDPAGTARQGGHHAGADAQGR